MFGGREGRRGLMGPLPAEGTERVGVGSVGHRGVPCAKVLDNFADWNLG